MNKYVAFVFSSVVCLFVALLANIACAGEPNLNAETAYNRVFEDGIANALNDVIHNSIDSVDDEVNNLRLLNVPHSELVSKVFVLRKKLISEKYEEAEKALREVVDINETILKIQEARKSFHEKAKAAFEVKNLNSGEIAAELDEWNENEIKAELNNWNWDEKKANLEEKIKVLCKRAKEIVKFKEYKDKGIQDKYSSALADYKKSESLYRKIVDECLKRYEEAKNDYNNDVKKLIDATFKKSLDETKKKFEETKKQLKLEEIKSKLDEAEAELKKAKKNIKELKDDYELNENKYTDEERSALIDKIIKAADACKEKEENRNSFRDKYKNAERKFKIVEDNYYNHFHIDYISHDRYAEFKVKASEVADIFLEIDESINEYKTNLESDNEIQEVVTEYLKLSKRLRTFPLRLEIILSIIEVKDKEAGQTKEVLDNLFANINTAFAIAYFNKGVNGKNLNGDFDKSIGYAKKIQDKNLSSCVQGLCFYYKTIYEPDDAQSDTFKNNAISFLKGIGSNSFNSGNIRELQQFIERLNDISPFIKEAEKVTLNGDANAAIDCLETGLKIHRNNPELARFLLDSYRRSSNDVDKLKIIYTKYNKTLDNTDNALISKALFLSHLLDKTLATTPKKYNDLVSSFNNELLEIQEEINSRNNVKLTMASIALQYSKSFTTENSSNEKLRKLSEDSHQIILRNHGKRVDKIKNMDEILLNELLLKTYLARGRFSLENNNQNEEQKVENVLGRTAYSEANNLISTLPYKYNLEIHKGDALLMKMKNYSSVDIESPFTLQTESDLIGKLKSVYELYVMNFNEIEKIVPQLNNNQRDQSNSIYKAYHSFAERDFDIICERLKNQVNNKGYLDRLLVPFQALALVRGQNSQDSIAYLFAKFKVDSITDIEKIIDGYCKEPDKENSVTSDFNNADLEKTLLLYTFAETLHGLNMSFDLSVNPQINEQPITRSQLRKTILELYNKVAILSKENSLNYLNIMAERGCDFYRDETFITGIIEGYRSSFDSQPQHTIKIVKEALRIHPESHKLCNLWIESEMNLFRRNDLSNKSDYCNTLLKDLELFNKVSSSENKELKFGIEFGVEMLRGIVYKEQGKFKEASDCFEKAAMVSHATPEEKAWALSMSVMAQTASLDSSDND